MNAQKLTLVGVLAAALATVAWFMLFDAPSGMDATSDQGTEAADATDLDAAGKDDASTGSDDEREAVEATSTRENLVDEAAEYNEALSGFRGRVVNHQREPVADAVVRFYRIDGEVLQFRGLWEQDPETAEELGSDIKVAIHEGKTDAEGRFEITGAWPNAFYILEANAEGDDRLTKPIDRTPQVSEIVDLGDIELVQLGVIVGRVVDEDGEGVPGALIRAADIPGSFLDLAPVERFDPEGGMIIREGSVSAVIEMPPFVKRYFDLIMKPRTTTLANGSFRLTAVQPRENVLAVNKRKFVPATKKGIKVKAGKEKDIGTVRLREGEEAFVKVLDTNDKPVVGAELMIGATNILFPADFGLRAGETDAKGEFYMTGWPAGKITVAARRSKEHRWVVLEPKSVAGDIVMRLPARHHLDLKILSEAGIEITQPKFKLLPSPDEGMPLDVGALGFVKWLNIDKNVEHIEKNQYRITDLIPGKYTLAVGASRHAAARLDFKIEGNATATVKLRPESAFDVQVLTHYGKPVSRAKIYVLTRAVEAGRKLFESPVVAGTTDKKGVLTVRDGEAGTVRLSASHPAFGYAHAEVKLPTTEPVVLKMADPGVIVGQLSESGRRPTPGKWTVIAEPRGRREKGAMPDLPKFVVPDLEGKFRIAGLRPGQYRVQVMQSISALTSPGGMIGFMMRARMLRDIVRKECEVVAGNETFLEIEAVKEAEPVTGPSARVSGSILVNGRPGVNLTVTGEGQRRFGVTSDKTGRFDLGQVPVGSLEVAVRDTSKAEVMDFRMESHLWQRNFKIEEGKDVVLDIEISTGKVGGSVRLADGSPAAAVRVRARGMQVSSSQKVATSASAVTMTDDKGRYSFKDLPAGGYTIEAKDRKRGAGKSKPVQVQSSSVLLDVDIALADVHTVRGKVVFPGGEKPEWAYLQFKARSDPSRESGASIRGSGNFRMRGLVPGTYDVTVYMPNAGRSESDSRQATPAVTIIDKDLKDIVITVLPPQPKTNQKPPRKNR